MRAVVLPDPARTVHFLGDVHAGAISQSRLDKVVRDLSSPTIAQVAARVQVGDSCDDGTAAQDALAAAFYARFADGVAMRTVPGNHDTYGKRTTATWAASLGVLVTPWTWDLGFVRLIGVGDLDGATASSAINNIYLPQSHLDYLDAALAASPKPCWIICHAPLADTVLGGSSADNQQNTTSGGGFFSAHAPLPASTDTAIRTILGSHANAKAWICGHTHSDINSPGFLTTLSLGGHNVAHLNCSSIYYTGSGTIDSTDRMCSLYVTEKSDDSGLEVRVRDHGASSWIGVGVGSSQRVTTINY